MKKNGLIICNKYSSFVEIDYKILSKYHYMNIIVLNNKNKRLFLHNIIDLIRYTFTSDFVLIWFLYYHSILSILLAKIFRKKIFLIPSGYSVAEEPSINYGNLVHPIMKHFTRLFLNLSDVIINVSKSNMYETSKLTNKKLCLIYHGVDHEIFSKSLIKEDIVISVGAVTHDNLNRKGLMDYIKASTVLPQYTFYLIGAIMDDSINILKKTSQGNVIFTGKLPFNELLSYYKRAKVYVQLSAHEAFGMSVAEAMLCNCIPVVTKKGSLPEVIGNCGLYCKYNDPKHAARKIKLALEKEINNEGRERIIKKFSLKERERKLIKIFNGLS